jgi:hypothetical protein
MRKLLIILLSGVILFAGIALAKENALEIFSWWTGGGEEEAAG